MSRIEDSMDFQLRKNKNQSRNFNKFTHLKTLLSKVFILVLGTYINFAVIIGQPYDPRHISMQGRPTKAPLAH